MESPDDGLSSDDSESVARDFRTCIEEGFLKSAWTAQSLTCQCKQTNKVNCVPPPPFVQALPCPST